MACGRQWRRHPYAGRRAPDSMIRDNSSNANGGAIYVHTGTLAIASSTLRDNESRSSAIGMGTLRVLGHHTISDRGSLETRARRMVALSASPAGSPRTITGSAFTGKGEYRRRDSQQRLFDGDSYLAIIQATSAGAISNNGRLQLSGSLLSAIPPTAVHCRRAPICWWRDFAQQRFQPPSPIAPWQTIAQITAVLPATAGRCR